jgi:peptide/nickel transport system substrate-binding protein
MRRPIIALALLLALAQPTQALDLVEPPVLAAQVAAGKLPPIAERLPKVPAVAGFDEPGQGPGVHGGAIRLLMASARDLRMMVVYGYARLIGYTPALDLKADILERFEVEDGRIFTFHLRPGHRWSDGAPFTAEDFRFCWEDIQLDRELSPSGASIEFLVDDEPAKFEVLNPTAVRYSWSKPNPNFLPAIAGPRPLDLAKPAHYLKNLHRKYADPGELERRVKEARLRNWSALFTRESNLYNNDNPDLPTLQPWMLATRPPSERFVSRRNPYYHRIDPQGRQLPYLDEVDIQIADTKIIPAKVGGGESDLQARYLRFDNYTFLKSAEKRNEFVVRLWRTGRGADLALYPNLNVNDPAWRQLNRDVRWRRALSLGINRREINQVIFYGLGREGGNTILPDSKLFEQRFQTAWAQFDPRQANELLDQIGLTQRDSRGIRLRPDGKPLNLIVETAGESTEQVDALQLVHDAWLNLGIKIYIKPAQREVFRSRIFAGETIMSIWFGLDNGLVTPDTVPQELAPVDQQLLQWPKWGQYVETKGKSGEPVDLPAAKELMDLYNDWRLTNAADERARIWKRMLAIYADNVFSIGIVSGVPQPVVVHKRLRNVPANGIFNWDPGAHFGIYRTDLLYFDGPPPRQTAQQGQ